MPYVQIVFPQDRLNIVTVAGENATIYFTGDRLLYAVNYARVVSFDPIRCSNGLIFIIDNVLMPAALMVNKALPVPAPPASPPTQSLGIMLASDSRFSTLGKAVVCYVCVQFDMMWTRFSFLVFVCSCVLVSPASESVGEGQPVCHAEQQLIHVHPVGADQRGVCATAQGSSQLSHH